MLPAEIQSITNFSTGFNKDNKSADVLAKFLTTSADAVVIKAKGLKPR
jgi:hypothetical protein